MRQFYSEHIMYTVVYYYYTLYVRVYYEYIGGCITDLIPPHILPAHSVQTIMKRYEKNSECSY